MKSSQIGKDEHPKSMVWYHRTWSIILAIIIFWPLGIFLMWKYKKWPKKFKVALTVAYAILTIVLVVAIINAPPYLTVNNLATNNRISTDDSKYALTGNAALGSVVTINGAVAARDDDSFSATIPLNEGDNNIDIKAINDKKETDEHIIIHRTTAAEFQARKAAVLEAAKRAEDAKKAADATKAKEEADAAKAAADAEAKAAVAATQAAAKKAQEAQTESSTPTIGRPFKISAPDGSSADITIIGISYPKTTPSGTPPLADEYVVLDVQIAGKSSQPFHYSEQNFDIRYADSGSNPYQKYSNTRTYNVDPTVWAAFSPNLGQGNLTSGQTARGTVPFDMSKQSQVVVEMTDDSLTNTLAQWLFTTH